MQLKSYQIKAVESLLRSSHALLAQTNPTYMVFKAPTGSGKTIMMAAWLEQFAQRSSGSYSFLWISGNDLHKQSRDKLESYLHDSRYTLSYLEEASEDEFAENEITFINWHSLVKQDKATGEYNNVYMRETEDDKSLPSMIQRTRDAGREIILIVDESHYHYWSTKTQELINTVISPMLTFEVSATPSVMPSAEDITDHKAALIKVDFEDVVAEGMIKKQAVINQAMKRYVDLTAAADDAVLYAAMEKLDELKKAYRAIKVDVNPLLLIQLPNASKNTDSTDESKIDAIEMILAKQYGISYENGKLALWLSDRKENTESIEKFDSEVEVLIFKQAIALGWDCPRAQVLVMFRDIKSHTFEIQTVGRILRMPEAKHYDSDLLDKAYVYTNLDKITVKTDLTDRGYFEIHRAARVTDYRSAQLPSVHVSRQDYGDLTYLYRTLFVQTINTRLGIANTDIGVEAKRKADKVLDLEQSELTKPVLADVTIDNIDEVLQLTGDTVNFKVSPIEVKRAFELYAKSMSLPFGPVRSHTKVQSAFYDWFDGWLGYKGVSRLEIQRIVVCSMTNIEFFTEVINETKEHFKTERAKELLTQTQIRQFAWDVPVQELYNDLYTTEPYSKYMMSPAYLQSSRSQVEKGFEGLLEQSKQVTRWYKNGSAKDGCLAIPYVYDGLTRSFYPDFIVWHSDDTIGIYDTKGGIIKDQGETAAKSDALYTYLKDNSKYKVKGGIVINDKSGWKIYSESRYTKDLGANGWKNLDL